MTIIDFKNSYNKNLLDLSNEFNYLKLKHKKYKNYIYKKYFLRNLFKKIVGKKITNMIKGILSRRRDKIKRLKIMKEGISYNKPKPDL